MVAATSKLSPAGKRITGKGAKSVATAVIGQTSRSHQPLADAPMKKTSSATTAANGVVLAYKRSLGVDAYIRAVNEATPVKRVEMERQGVAGAFITDLSKRMDLPSSRVFAMLRIPPATAARKSAAGAVVDGRAGLAAMGMIKLLGIAQDIVQVSTATEAKGFDTLKWLGQWIERPQAALGGRKPSEYLDTPTGVEIVAQLLGAMRSGAYL